ncbi:MAG: DUF3987 domain-containing protein [Nostoc sp. NOS(2021)]|uniref:DUF3987 domain-containing protein n=1 Tax=Nostoc sp. NOS(2021) TaxID=2815407 RepID=UPI0025F87810|nr:DUF3987 domain-containing protein [Nostoc sp. NOS(2021)]MBN3893809.1 DUF3987 domain-containing protein [Nostoc sp. NOS(2021)]
MIASPAIALKPCLYTTDLGAVVSLSSRFATGDLFNMPETLDKGMHVALVDKHTPEVAVRQWIYRILASGNSNIPQIYQTQQPIAILAADESVSPEELSTQIMHFSQDCDRWLKTQSQQKLTLQEAVQIAKVIMAYEQEPQRSVELGTLRMRCDQKSYDWNMLMGKLEKELLEELQKRGITVESGKKTDNVDVAKIQEEYIKLLESVADDTSIEKFKIKVREQYSGLQPSELNKLLDAVTGKFLHEQAQVDEASEIAKLVEATEETISVHDYLPAILANPLAQYSQYQKLRHAVLLSSFLTAASSLHKVGTELVIHAGEDFTVVPTLFGAIVAESGAKKSPTTKATARGPLNILKTLDQQTYERDFKRYEAELASWKKRKSLGDEMSEPEPEEPDKPPLYYFTDATGEGIKAQAASASKKALFGLFDELAGFFNSSNQYRGGKGSDKQDLLSYFDGTGVTVLRAAGVKADVNKVYLSILGTIQPDVLRKAMENTNDVDGSWARFIYAIQPNLPGTLPDDNGSSFDMKDLIAGFFRKIHELPVTEYRLSKEAFKFYQPYYKRLEQLRVSHPSNGMKAVYAKAEGITGRLALNLHVLHELASERSPSVEIPLERMKEAISLMKFYIGQIKLIYAFVDDSSPVPQVLKVIELSKRKQLGGEDGWIKAKDIQNASSKKQRFKANEVREWIIQAAKSGHGETKGEGIRLEFKAFMEKVGSKVGESRSKVGHEPTVKNLAVSSFQEKVGFVGHSYDDSPTFQITQPQTTKPEITQPEITQPEITQPEITQPIIDDSLANKDLVSGEPTKPTNAENPDTAAALAVGHEPTFTPTIEPTFQNPTKNGSTRGDFPSVEYPETETESVLSDTSDSDTALSEIELLNEPISLLQAEREDEDVTDYIGRQVEVRASNRSVKFAGKIVKCNVKNGIVTVMTEQGNREAAFREAFIIV